MKKLLSYLPFILACCLLIAAIGWGLIGICDTYREVQRLKTLQGASGADYLGVHLAGVLFGGGVFLASCCGMIFSGISRWIVKDGKLRTASGVLTVLFGVLLVLSMSVCILGMI